MQATFGELLRRWRRDRGLSQRGFAELISPKVHAVTVSCWENDVRCPSLKHLRQIVALTGIPGHLALDLPAVSQEDTPS
jgi:transcriptional regulator with XRE-family HTH domain